MRGVAQRQLRILDATLAAVTPERVSLVAAERAARC
jgi:hypothetical protein